jgi:hypothetical protein
MHFVKQDSETIGLPHPIFRAAFRQYAKCEVYRKLGFFATSQKLYKLLHDPKHYMTIDQVENFAGLTNQTFEQVLSAIRGVDMSGATLNKWFEDV